MNDVAAGHRRPAASPAKFAALARSRPTSCRTSSAFNTGRRELHGRQLSRAARGRDACRPTSSSCSARRSLWAGRFTAEEDRPTGRASSCSATRCGRRRFSARPEHRRQDHLARRRAVHDRRRPRTSFDFREFGPTPEVWLPFQFDPNTTDQGHYFQVAGRLKPGVTLEQAQRAAEAVGRATSARSSRTRSARRRLQRRSRSATCIVATTSRSSLLVLRRRGQLRAADRVRQRRQPAAGPRDRPPARDRHPRRDRRGRAAASSGSC